MKTWAAVFFLLVFMTAPLFAEEIGNTSNTSRRIMRLIEQLDQLEKNQQQILVTQDEIVSKIKNLKIQAHR